MPARDVSDIRFLDSPPGFIRYPTRKSGRKWRGILYEREASAHLAEQFGDAYIPGPWIQFTDGPTGERRYCQPDGLVVEPRRGRVTVIEFKYYHTDLAYWQLFHLYIPVIQAAFPAELWQFAGVEVCARFDCAITCPEKPVLRKNILDAYPMQFNVHIWRT